MIDVLASEMCQSSILRFRYVATHFELNKRPRQTLLLVLFDLRVAWAQG